MTAALVAIGVAAVVVIAAFLRGRRPALKPMNIDPFALSEPWRRSVSAAQASQRRYSEIVASTPAGPLRSNMESITRQVQRGVEECWLIAKRGDELDAALKRLDRPSLQARLDAADDEAMRSSLQSQLDVGGANSGNARRRRSAVAIAEHPPWRAPCPCRRGQRRCRYHDRSGQRRRRRRHPAGIVATRRRRHQQPAAR